MSDGYTKEQKQEMLEIARSAIKSHLNSNYTEKQFSEQPDYLKSIRACFVTLHTKQGSLRGCIGNIVANEPLYDNIKNNAVNAAFRDPRFPSIKSIDDLDFINIEISILTPLKSVDSHKDIVLGKHGIVLKSNGKGSVFLPHVPTEQNWDLQTTLTNLSMKAGLSPNAWQMGGTKFEVFEAIVFGEKDEE